MASQLCLLLFSLALFLASLARVEAYCANVGAVRLGHNDRVALTMTYCAYTNPTCTGNWTMESVSPPPYDSWLADYGDQHCSIDPVSDHSYFFFQKQYANAGGRQSFGWTSYTVNSPNFARTTFRCQNPSSGCNFQFHEFCMDHGVITSKILLEIFSYDGVLLESRIL